MLLQIPRGPARDPPTPLPPATGDSRRHTRLGEGGKPRGRLHRPRHTSGAQQRTRASAARSGPRLASLQRQPPLAATSSGSVRHHQAGPEETRVTLRTPTAPITPPTPPQPLSLRRLWRGGERTVPSGPGRTEPPRPPLPLSGAGGARPRAAVPQLPARATLATGHGHGPAPRRRRVSSAPARRPHGAGALRPFLSGRCDVSTPRPCPGQDGTGRGGAGAGGTNPTRPDPTQLLAPSAAPHHVQRGEPGAGRARREPPHLGECCGRQAPARQAPARSWATWQGRGAVRVPHCRGPALVGEGGLALPPQPPPEPRLGLRAGSSPAGVGGALADLPRLV